MQYAVSVTVMVEASSVDEAAIYGYGRIVKEMRFVVADTQQVHLVGLRERALDIECSQNEHAFREAFRPRPKVQLVEVRE